MGVRYDDIANRLKAFRLSSGLTAEEIARRAGVSRTAFYRLEKGELVKLETLEKLSELLNVSVATLLGVEIEYIPSAVAYFERLRQIEEQAEHITVLAGPISWLLASDDFNEMLNLTLRESLPEELPDRARVFADIARIMDILEQRKESYRRRQPSIVNLMSGLELGRFARDGMTGTYSLPEDVRHERRARARAEIEHFARVIEDCDIGVQIGIVPEALQHTGFQIFRQPDRQILSVSPFRLGEHPNIHLGVAMITSATEALALHRNVVSAMWKRALKGSDAVRYLRNLLDASKDAAVSPGSPPRPLSVVRGSGAHKGGS